MTTTKKMQGKRVLVTGSGTGIGREIAVELAHKGIRVNAIAPGWVMVENYYEYISGFNEEEAKEAAKKKVPLGRYGEPIDIAKLAVISVLG